jgi:eukaryotic-like serine/threonine-protein kinase
VNPDRWNRVKDLFQQALERKPGERAPFLAAACAGDDELNREVMDLLRAHEEAGSFLESPALSGLESLEASPPPRTRIGPYAILDELGQGGMGTVFLAARDDDAYRKKVAIKLIRSGADSEAIVRRFRTERQILANLSHPNIAALLDGGTTEDGLPYLVMEYIEGEPIPAYCARHHLSVAGRLELFRKVCGAVRHAHRNLVVHRDIKPGNVFVTTDGVPKLLDFGLAKLLDPEGNVLPEDLTAAHERLMTPAYASPEQLRGRQVTTASDVYSLGVLLYEILAGTHPYGDRRGDFSALVSAVCHEDPPPPSAAARTSEGAAGAARARELSGDLDAIVLKAMRKEPGERYGSVDDLSADLEHYLERRPVTARRGSWAYVLGKGVRRHRVAIAAGFAVVASLVAGIVLSRIEARRAERRYTEVRDLATTYLFEFHDAISALPGATAARELVIRRGLEHLERLGAEAGTDPALKRELGRAYVRMGDLQSGGRVGPTVSTLGDFPGAVRSYAAAVRFFEDVSASPRATAGDRVAFASALVRLSVAQAHNGEFPGPASTERARSILESVLEADPGNVEARREQALAYRYLGAAAETAADTAAEIRYYEKDVALSESLAAGRPAGSPDVRSLTVALTYLGRALGRAGRGPEAVSHLERALALDTAALEASPGNTQAVLDVAFSRWALADALVTAGELDRAQALAAQARTTAAEQMALDPRNLRPRTAAYLAEDVLARARIQARDWRGASAALDEARKATESVLRESPTDLRARMVNVRTLAAMGDVHLQLARSATFPEARRQQTASACEDYVAAEASLSRLAVSVRATELLGQDLARKLASCRAEAAGGSDTSGAR